MPSFNAVNYSLRPNKSIQRSIVFEGLHALQQQLGIRGSVYIGFGSVWFTDFTFASRALDLSSLVSIEQDEVGWKRAEFNKPFRNVRVEHGMSTEILENLSRDGTLNSRHWIVWLDYDGALDETVIEDIRFVVENAPINSVLLLTFNAVGKNYGKPRQRAERIRSLLGAVVPEGLSDQECDDANIASTLGRYVTDFIISAALSVSRPGGFEPAFKIFYRDGASMVTVGGVLPAPGAVPQTKSCLTDKAWGGRPELPITTPLLTLKEAAVLQAQLPRRSPLTRKSVQRLGFDLEEEQIRAFEKFYKYYPSFAQITL